MNESEYFLLNSNDVCLQYLFWNGTTMLMIINYNLLCHTIIYKRYLQCYNKMVPLIFGYEFNYKAVPI